jgi:hypothetical protein
MIKQIKEDTKQIKEDTKKPKRFKIELRISRKGLLSTEQHARARAVGSPLSVPYGLVSLTLQLAGKITCRAWKRYRIMMATRVKRKD